MLSVLWAQILDGVHPRWLRCPRPVPLGAGQGGDAGSGGKLLAPELCTGWVLQGLPSKRPAESQAGRLGEGVPGHSPPCTAGLALAPSIRRQGRGDPPG